MALMPNIAKILFSPRGRMGRRDYLIGLVGLAVIFFAYGIFLGWLGTSMIGFFAVLIYPFLILHIAYCVYGKRLHDMGRSFWPLTAAISLIIIAMIVVSMSFGGAEYFAEYSQFTRDNPAPSDVAERLNAEYQARQKEGIPYLSAVVLSILIGFSLWLAVAKPDAKVNRYGAP